MANDTNGDGWFSLSCGLFVGFGVVAVICWIAFDNLFWRIVICVYFVGIPTLAALLGMIGSLLPGTSPLNTNGLRPPDDWDDCGDG